MSQVALVLAAMLICFVIGGVIGFWIGEDAE